MVANLPSASGHGIVRTGHPHRVHILRPQDWADAAGTDFWAFFGNVVATEGGVGDLDDFGWVTTGFSVLAGSGADFLSGSPTADIGTTGGINFDTASDALTSPFIFGDYAHGRMVQEFLRHFPTELNMECYARFAATGDENGSGFGFLEAGGTPIEVASTMAYISSGGTVFELHSGAAEDAGDTDDTDPHLWRIKCTGTTAEWFIDGTSQGTIALQDDLWPVAFSAGTQSGGSNDPVLSWVHVWYS